jgi:hypothetical protein
MEFIYELSVTPPGEDSYPMEFRIRAATQEQADARAEQLREVLTKLPATRWWSACNRSRAHTP